MSKKTRFLGTRVVSWVTGVGDLIMPFWQAWRANREIDSRIDSEVSPYEAIPLWVLKTRLEQEHNRADSIEAKTDRLGQRLLGILAFAGVLVTLSRPVDWTWFGVIGLLLSLVYVVVGWYITLKANQTSKMFGKGTEFEYRAVRDTKVLSSEVFCQELANTKKHNSNVAAFNCLRNGLLLAAVTVIGIWVMDLLEPISEVLVSC